MIFIDPSLDATQQRKAYGRVLEDFTSLLKHPAWAIFSKYLEDEEGRLLNKLGDISAADAALHATAVLGTIRRIRQIPENTAKTAAEALKQL